MDDCRQWRQECALQRIRAAKSSPTDRASLDAAPLVAVPALLACLPCAALPCAAVAPAHAYMGRWTGGSGEVNALALSTSLYRGDKGGASPLGGAATPLEASVFRDANGTTLRFARRLPQAGLPAGAVPVEVADAGADGATSYLNWAYGTTDELDNHGPASRGSFEQVLRTAASAPAVAALPASPARRQRTALPVSRLRTHGRLMLIAWAGLLPAGAVLGRLVQHPRLTPYSFFAHVAVQASGLAVAAVSFALIVAGASAALTSSLGYSGKLATLRLSPPAAVSAARLCAVRRPDAHTVRARQGRRRRDDAAVGAGAERPGAAARRRHPPPPRLGVRARSPGPMRHHARCAAFMQMLRDSCVASRCHNVENVLHDDAFAQASSTSSPGFTSWAASFAWGRSTPGRAGPPSRSAWCGLRARRFRRRWTRAGVCAAGSKSSAAERPPRRCPVSRRASARPTRRALPPCVACSERFGAL